jgi:hypothetical protein
VNEQERLELAARLMQAASQHEDVRMALAGTLSRYGAEDLSDFAERFPDEFELLAEALLDMVDEVRNVRGSRDA